MTAPSREEGSASVVGLALVVGFAVGGFLAMFVFVLSLPAGGCS